MNYMAASHFKKWLLVGISCIGSLVAGWFIFTGWNEYQAKQDFKEAKELISSRQNINEGLALMEASLLHLSKDAQFIRDYGGILSGLGWQEEAIAVYKKAQKVTYSPSALISLSSLYSETGQFDKSIDYAQKALSTLPWKLTPRYKLASGYFNSGNKQKAFEYALDTVITPMKVSSNRGMELKRSAREMMPLCIPEGFSFDGQIGLVTSAIDDLELKLRLETALLASGENRKELEKALFKAAPEQLDSLIFLLVNMPETDLRNLDSSYLLSNIESAYAVRKIWPFMPDIPEDIFLSYLLPYAQIGEKRDNWREEFMKRYLPVVGKCKSAGEVVLSLQTLMPNELNIQFDNDNRSDSFWSVGNTIKNKLANCISLSVLVADACRSVGIPARVITIPKWKDAPGGHTWVEIYD